MLFHFHHTNTRGHTQKLYKCHCIINIQIYFFSQRIKEPWNNLPEDGIKAKNVNNFKNVLNKCWKDSVFKCVPYYGGPDAAHVIKSKNGPERHNGFDGNEGKQISFQTRL